MAPTPIILLQLSPTMTEGTIVKWLVKEGDKVEDGQAIAEIETDKAVMEQTSFEEGTILKILVEEGSKVSVEQLIAVVGAEGDDISGILGGDSKPAPAKAAKKSDATPIQSTKEEPKEQKKETSSAASQGRVFASPLARKMAKDAGVDIAEIDGSGPNGRVIKVDVEAAISGGGASAAVATSSAPAAPAKSAPIITTTATVAEEIPLSGMRQTIARRLTESKQLIPHFTLSVDIRGEALLATVAKIRAANPNHKVTVTHFLIKAMASVQMRHKAIRSQWAGDKLNVIDGAHISVAVAIDEGLVTPVLRDADRKGLLQIGTEIKELAAKARDRKLSAEDMSGGTQTISNLGMFNTKEFTAIINPPESSILAIGAMEDRPVVENGQIVPGKVMTITASFDHRVIDGAVGAQFMDDLKKALEDPLTMLL